jgi:hypothetical protein
VAAESLPPPISASFEGRGQNLPAQKDKDLMIDLETFEDAVGWRKVHRKRLRSGNREHREVARELKSCRASARCETEACRVCLRAFRLHWVGEVTKIVVQRPHWTRSSIIPDGMLLPYGSLNVFDLKAAVKRAQKRIERSGISDRIVIGGVDVSLNLSDNNMIGWQLHPYLLVEGKNDRALRKALKAAFPPEPSAAKPYDFREVEDPLKAITYAYKAVFKRRSAYIDADGKAQTRALPLKDPDQREILQFLAKYKVGSRAILRGVRRNGKSFALTKKG